MERVALVPWLQAFADELTARHPERGPLHGHQAQVQIRTVLQHAWAEFEHDIRYKGSVPPEHVLELDRRFTLAAGDRKSTRLNSSHRT